MPSGEFHNHGIDRQAVALLRVNFFHGSVALGAQGAWLGTVWLAAAEHRTHPLLLAKLAAAGSDDTVVTRAHSGKPCRVVRSAWSDEWAAPGAPDTADGANGVEADKAGTDGDEA